MNKYKIEEKLSNIQFQVYSDMNFIEPLGLDKETWKELLDYITNLQEENEYSNHCNEELRKKITNLEYKIERLEEDNKQLKDLCDKYEEEHSTTFEEWKKDIKIIDELEKWLIDNIEYGDDDYYDMKAMGVESALNKLKELKENK